MIATASCLSSQNAITSFWTISEISSGVIKMWKSYKSLLASFETPGAIASSNKAEPLSEGIPSVPRV